jgi:hypothetical protein
MAVDQTRIDLLSLDDFSQHLTARLAEAQETLTALTAGAGSQRPPLGDFHDAQLTADRYQAMKALYTERLRRLIDALSAAQTATATISASYRTVEDRNHLDTGTIGGLLGPAA